VGMVSTLAAVRDAVRARVPVMNADREVSEQIMTVDELLPEICITADARCGGLA
jgi:histidine ammonia-lyase